MSTVQLLILVGGVLLLGTIVFSGAGILLYFTRKPARQVKDSKISELEGRIAAVERRQEDLETDVVKKLRSANTRLQRAQQLTAEEVEEEEAQLPLLEQNGAQPAQGPPRSRREVIERARAGQ